MPAQDLCREYRIPTGSYEVFRDPELAKRYIREQGAPIVVKAVGLAAGKGVVVAHTVAEAAAAVDDMLVERKFGDAGEWCPVFAAPRISAHCRAHCVLVFFKSMLREGVLFWKQ